MTDVKPLILIDGYGFIFRAFHVQPPLTAPDGEPIGAIYGFLSMLLKIISDFKPSRAAVILDSPGKNFRHEIYPEYKSHRPAVPEDLLKQLPKAREAAKALNFAVLEQSGYEADDIIATLAYDASKSGQKVVVISADKDLLQLMNENIQIYDPIKNRYATKESVFEKFGVLPEKIRDFLALTGDSSDNIPGIKSVGPKTAAELLNQFGSFENIINNYHILPAGKRRQLIEDGIEAAKLSYQLVGLNSTVNLTLNQSDLSWTAPESAKIIGYLEHYNFKSLMKRALSMLESNVQIAQLSINVVNIENSLNIINNENELKKILEQAEIEGEIALQFIEMQNKPIGIIFSITNYSGVVFFNKEQLVGQGVLFCLDDGSSQNWIKDRVKTILQNSKIHKITYDLKALLHYLEINENDSDLICGVDDLKIMKYVLSAGLEQEELFIEFDKNLSEEQFCRQAVNIISNFNARFNQLKQELWQEKALNLYYDIDLPLVNILYKMEKNGILIDKYLLEDYSRELTKEIQELENQIYEIAGCQFNIGSPKQLGEVLFEKMNLPAPKLKSKSQNLSTKADILEYLSAQGYDIADLLLKWRQLNKLKTTYAEGLINQINSKTGRIHTNFLQTSTATSRLSSQNPNLQNIPIRSEEGLKIRQAFIARPGYMLLSADYSQIELRLLSEIANIESMQKAFKENLDIHSITASKIFNLTVNQVTSEHRRKAKAINFGIIYGISAFGLAKQLTISNYDAGEYINQYFIEYDGIKQYMEDTKALARREGYVKNLFGRKCFVPSIISNNFVLRQFAERAAINAPIQGSSSDIVKIAMININQLLTKGYKAKLLLQIHDELVFEIPENEIDELKSRIKDIMENAYQSKIYMKVDIRTGQTLRDVH